MRITKETHQVLINNKMQEFVEKAASFLSSRFETLILSKGITRPILKESVYQCYLWTEHLSHPSQLFAVRMACVRLCFGSCSYPCNVDTALSEVLVFKLFRAESATGTVTTPSIVITLDIIKYRRAHYFPTDNAFAVDTFHFQ